MGDVLSRHDCVLLADRLPQLSNSTQKERSLAYLLGGLMTDGHVHLTRTRGEVMAGEALRGMLERHRITHATLTPSAGMSTEPCV